MAEDKIFTVNAWKALLNNLITKFKTKDFTAKEKLTIGSSEIYNKVNGEQLDFSNIETKGITKIGDLKEEYIFEANQATIVADTALEGKAGYTESGLYVDATATTGKYGGTNDSWKQVNTGTKIYIPMSSSGTLIVSFYNSGTVYIGSEEKREVSVHVNKNIEIFDNDIITFENNKYVVIEIISNNFINYIKTISQKTVYSIELNNDGINLLKGLVVQETAKFLRDLNVGYSVNTGTLSYTFNDLSGSTVNLGSIGSYDELIIDCSNGGKFSVRTSDIQINTGAVLYIPYKGDGTLSIGLYKDANYTGSYTVNGNTLTINSTTFVGETEIKESECVDGKIKIVCISSGYIIGPIAYNYSTSMPLVSIKDGRISHGGNRTDDLKNQKIPFFKEITQEEYDNLTTKDEDVVYLIEE